MRELRRLVVVEQDIHHRHAGRLWAYGPYVREIDVWADLFGEVVIAAPCRDEPPPADYLPFSRPNISIRPQKQTGGLTLAAKLRQVLAVPGHVYRLSRALSEADAVHVRCPGNLGLLGVLLAPVFARPLVAKYAGQWCGFADEPWSWRLQRAVLRSRWWRGPVTVYGRWPGQPAHVVPFFTSILSSDQVARARAAASDPKFADGMRVLYVGRLSEAKNVDVLLSAVASLPADVGPVRCRVVGEGPEREALAALAGTLGIADRVEFTGGVEFARVLEYYEEADVLVLASQCEGWPKAIAEGMAFGLVCIGSNVGFVPEMLGEGRGLLVPPRDVAALGAALRTAARSPEQRESMRRRAAVWAQRFSLEGLRDALTDLFAAHWESWGGPPRAADRAGEPQARAVAQCGAAS